MNKGLPSGFARSKDHTIVNSNGIAAQPDTRIYSFGGEINTPPTTLTEGQEICLCQILLMHPSCTVNHRSNLHIHVRVPGLGESLKDLKRFQLYIHEELPKVINLIEPIPKGTTLAEKKRERRRKVSHHTFLTNKRLEHQLKASTIKEFFEREVPHSQGGKPLWHAQPRLAVGLRQILQTDTVEFRHFPGTLDSQRLRTCVAWCRDFTEAALTGRPFSEILRRFRMHEFPSFPIFNLDLEIGYQATAAHNGLSKEEIRQNIGEILDGTFFKPGKLAYKKAKAKAEGRKL